MQSAPWAGASGADAKAQKLEELREEAGSLMLRPQASHGQIPAVDAFRIAIGPVVGRLTDDDVTLVDEALDRLGMAQLRDLSAY